jgi:outer membrane murein-binding lipoprotein Lpp
MSEPKRESESKKTPSTAEELKQKIEGLESDLEAMRNDAKTFQRVKSELEEDNRKLTEEIGGLKTQLAQSYSRFSSFSLMRIETWTNSAMRLIVIFTFAIVGPILLAANLASLQISSVLLDIFKIWLGAAIGISTNLLQRTEKPERTATPEGQAPAPKTKKTEEP